MALLTPIKGLATPTNATIAKSNNLNGPIMDVPGSILNLVLDIEELQARINNLIVVTDASDPNLTVLNTALTTIN